MLKQQIAPSMMCADYRTFADLLKTFEEQKIEYLHIDVMDGVFVKNYTLGTDFCRRLREMTAIPLDIHLMITEPEWKIDWFAPRPGEYVSVHAEATDHLQRALAKIRDFGARPITKGTLSAGDNYDMNFTGAQFTINAKPEEPGTGSEPSTEISVNPSFNADNDASSPDYRVYGKPQREAARTAWLQDAMAPFTGGKFSVTAVEDGRRHGVELGFDATPISTSVQTHHEMYGIHDDEILDDHKVFDRYEHHVIEAQEPVSLDGDTEMDLSAAQDVMDALEDLLLEIPAVELTAKASQFHDDFDTALNDLLTI
ncbi:MAG: hypothetical protein IJ992_01025 [Lentisphaeria bacterium]|nr:hypothetical protein [Lentisphaeria bacterium]